MAKILESVIIVEMRTYNQGLILTNILGNKYDILGFSLIWRGKSFNLRK